MAATLMQLRRLVRARLGIPLGDDFMTDPVLDDHINLAIGAIEGEYHWPWAEAAESVTLDGTNPNIVQPDRWRATRAVMCGEQELAAVSGVDLLTWMDTYADLPKVWAPMVSVIAVRPIVSTPIEVRHLYYRSPLWLRADEDKPDMPEGYAGAIVAKASELLAARESSGGDATRHGAEYVTWVTRMRRDARVSTGPMRTRVRPGGWV